MRICFVCNEYPPVPHGGIGTFVSKLAKSLVGRGDDVWVTGYSAMTRKEIEETDAGVKLRLAPWPPRRVGLRVGKYALDDTIVRQRTGLSQRLNTLVAREGIEIVESHDWAGPLWSCTPCPLVVRLHGAQSAYSEYEGRGGGRLMRIFEKRNFRMAASLVAVSQHIANLTLKTFGAADRSVAVIPNFVDTEMFSPVPLIRDRNEVLYVGSVTRRKGLPDLFHAIPSVLRSFECAHFTIVGEAGEAVRKELLGILPSEACCRVRFQGRQPHEMLPALYRRAQVVVVPSRAEAFGLTCIEAMACGAAVVMTSLASGPEIVRDGESGLLSDPRNHEQLANSIVRLLQSSSLRDRIGEGARRDAVDRFEIERIVQQNADYYAAVLKHAARPLNC